MPNPNLYDKIKILEAQMNQIKSLIPKPEKKIQGNIQPSKNQAVFLENILGKMKTLKDTNSNISRNFGEQITLISTNGRHYIGLNFNDGWFYIRATASVTNNLI